MVGDIVLVNLPFTDLVESKRRPVLIIADVRDRNENDWLVCQITSSDLSHVREIAISPRDVQLGQLLPGSKVRPDRLSTLNERVFERTIGRLTDAKTAEIIAAVRSLF